MTNRAIVVPIGIDPRDWAAQLRIDWSGDDVPQWTDDMDWKDWGRRLVVQSTALRGAAPLPDQFDNFEDWALRVFDATY